MSPAAQTTLEKPLEAIPAEAEKNRVGPDEPISASDKASIVPTGTLNNSTPSSKDPINFPFKSAIVWPNVMAFIFLHCMALWAIPKIFISTKILTQAFALILGTASAQGVLIGAHRLYSHRSFKASWQLRLLVNILHTIAGQNCMYVWVRDHRLHHKHSDTDADPHNATRGFFFSHVGWLMTRKHPSVIAKGKTIDMSDLEKDGIVMFMTKYYKPLYFLLALYLPVAIPVYLWGESWTDALFIVYFLRYCVVLNLTWSVNSAAHLWGTQPYDKNLVPKENLFVGYVALGEGWHNYHHAFPWDYRAAEFGLHNSPTTQIIDYFVRKGWASDTKCASLAMVKRRMERTGDGTYHIGDPEPDPEETPITPLAEPVEITVRQRA